MKLLALVLLALTIGSPIVAQAGGMNRNFLVPFYDPCPGSGVCNPSTRPSAYTFESITLSSSRARYTAPGKVALAIAIKGLKDGNGNPASGRLEVRVTSRITIANLGTIGETSPLAETVYAVQVTDGNGRGTFKTPPETPASGLIVNSITSPIVYDPDGQPLATTGTQTKP